MPRRPRRARSDLWNGACELVVRAGTIGVFAIASLAVMLPQRAVAQTAEEQARAHFDAGVELLDTHEPARALSEFRAAYELWKNPKILLNIGTSLRQLGRDAEAANAYGRYLREPAADPLRKQEVSDVLREIDAAVGKLEIHVSQPDARVLIDGNPSIEWHREEPLRVAAGEHTLVVEKTGFAPVTSSVTVGRGEMRTVELVLVTTPAPAGEASTPPASAAVNTQTPAESDRVREQQPQSSRSSHANQLGAFVRLDIDGEGRGAVVVPGASFGLGDYVEVGAGGLIGRDKGVWLGGRLFALTGALKPGLLLGTPIFFVSGARVGLEATAGLVWDPSRHFGISVDFGIVHFLSTPEGYAATLPLASAGVLTRL
jgi:hypothetical protein